MVGRRASAFGRFNQEPIGSRATIRRLQDACGAPPSSGRFFRHCCPEEVDGEQPHDAPARVTQPDAFPSYRRRNADEGSHNERNGCSRAITFDSTRARPDNTRMTLLWTIDVGRAPIYIFGGGPPGRRRWHDPAIERLVRDADVFWNEVPDIAPEDAPLAAKFGIDAARPLASWLSAGELARVDACAATLGVDPQRLRPLRPWLCAQVVKRAAQALAGLVADDAAEVVLTNIARRANIPVWSELPGAEATFALFAGLPPHAEAALLSMELDDIERGLDAIVRDAEAGVAGDAEVGERFVEHMRTRYPALYGPLLIERNRQWVDRINGMIERGERAFIYVGSAHLAGPDSIHAMLSASGVAVRGPA